MKYLICRLLEGSPSHRYGNLPSGRPRKPDTLLSASWVDKINLKSPDNFHIQRLPILFYLTLKA